MSRNKGGGFVRSYESVEDATQDLVFPPQSKIRADLSPAFRMICKYANGATQSKSGTICEEMYMLAIVEISVCFDIPIRRDFLGDFGQVVSAESISGDGNQPNGQTTNGEGLSESQVCGAKEESKQK